MSTCTWAKPKIPIRTTSMRLLPRFEHLETGVHVAETLGGNHVAAGQFVVTRADDFQAHRAVVLTVHHGLEVTEQVDVAAATGLVARLAWTGAPAFAVPDVNMLDPAKHRRKRLGRIFARAVNV